ncbi:MAG: hypothetical protein WC629_02235 [Candidatus Paceibacterota bacterium]|jgi:hypothetical protein
MATFHEQNPIGKFSPLPKEIMDVRKKAMEAKLDPDAAEESLRKKLESANASIQEAKRKEALESLQKSAEKMLGEEDN